MQLLALFSNSMFHALMWQFWKSAHISETAARRAKISSISTPWGRKRKRVHMQLLELFQIPGFTPKYKNQPVSRKPLPVGRKQAQFQPHWDRKYPYATSVSLLKKYTNMPILIITLYLGNGYQTYDVVLSLFYTKNWHADLEFACKFCFLVVYCLLIKTDIYSKNTHWMEC